MVSHWSLSDSNPPQVSKTHPSILANLNNAVVWIVCNCPLIFKSSSPCINPLVTVPSAPITIGITITFMLHSFYSSLAKLRYLSLFSLSFSFTLFSKFFFLKLSLGLIIWPKLNHSFVSKSQRILCISFSSMDSEVCIYHLFVWSNFNLLHNSLWITFSTQSYTLFELIYCIHLLYE